MVRAHKMESEEARYPRVIIDPALIPLARGRRNAEDPTTEEEDYVRSFITVDADGRLFFDYVSWRSVVEVAGCNDDLYPDYLCTLSRLIRAGLAHGEPKVAEKYLWLHRKYEAAIDLLTGVGASARDQKTHPDNYAAIEALPRLSHEASRAQRRVEAWKAKRTCSAAPSAEGDCRALLNSSSR